LPERQKLTSRDAITALRGLGLTPVLLTGDNRHTARAVIRYNPEPQLKSRSLSKPNRISPSPSRKLVSCPHASDGAIA
jgi:hypothetical protein